MKFDSEKLKRKLDRLNRIKSKSNIDSILKETNFLSSIFTKTEVDNCSTIDNINFETEDSYKNDAAITVQLNTQRLNEINNHTLSEIEDPSVGTTCKYENSKVSQVAYNKLKKEKDLILAEDFSLYKDNIEEPKHLEKNRLQFLTGSNDKLFNLNYSKFSQNYNALKLKLRSGKVSTKQLYRELINCENCINKNALAEETYDCLLRVDEYERRFFENVLIKEILSLSNCEDEDLTEKSKKLTQEAYLYEINANRVKQKLINREDIFDLAKLTGQKFLLRLQQNYTYELIKNNYFYKEEMNLLEDFSELIKEATANELISEKKSCELIFKLLKSRNELASEFFYSDYFDMACNLQESVDLVQSDYQLLINNVKKQLAECFFLLNKQSINNLKDEGNLLNFHRLREKYIKNIAGKEITFEIETEDVFENTLPEISENQASIIEDIIYLLRRVLFDDESLSASHREEKKDEKSDDSSTQDIFTHELDLELAKNLAINNRQNNSFLKQIQRIKDEFPSSLLENGLIYFISKEKFLNYKRDRRLYSFQQRKRRFEHLPPSEFRTSTDSIIYLPQSRVAICLLDEVKHSYDIWSIINSLGRALRMIEAARVDLLLLEEKALRVNDLFSAYALETLTMQKMDEARQSLELYIENLLRRARYDDINSYHYKSILARKQLERLSPFRKRLNREMELKNNLIKRRLMAMIEDLLKSTLLYEFQLELYKREINSEDDIFELWDELHKKYFIDDIRKYKINDATVLKEIFYRPFDSKQKMLAVYSSLLMWDRAKSNYKQTVKDYKYFIKCSGHQSFYSLFKQIFNDEYLNEDMMKRLVYQLAKFLEAKSIGSIEL